LTNTLLRLVTAAKRTIDFCSDSKSAPAVIGLEPLKQAIIDAKARGVKLRYIAEITKDNIKHCKELMKIVSELRHLNGAMANFAVTESEYMASGASLRHEEPIPQGVYSKNRAIVRQQQYLFNSLWNNASQAERRIGDIEDGILPVKIEVIQDPNFSREIIKELLVSANEEILLVLPTARSFIRHEKLGTMQLLMEAASKRRVKIRIIMVKHKSIEKSIQNLLWQPPDSFIDARFIKKDEGSCNKTTSFLVDKKALLVVEIRDDSKDSFADAVGLSTYSNSFPGISAYISMFEDLWTQSQLYEHVLEMVKELASANERLKIHNKMQQEFINIAAHELRTPIQPILGTIEIIKSRMSETTPRQEKDGAMAGATNEEIEMIFRNAMRLERLSNDILDVTRIESGSLSLNKETFDLNQKVRNVVADMQKTYFAAEKEKLKIRVETSAEPLMVTADKQRIFEVISNLMSNAIKFTEEGNITISAGTKEDDTPAVTVKDTGSGIDSEIVPKLFEKFASKSGQGTGLGLYISKKIIEAHGGRIKGGNNPDGKGATFAFTLPLNA
jgi:two-component system sensor histidine kinase VicK